jgi:hypothetical protein
MWFLLFLLIATVNSDTIVINSDPSEVKKDPLHSFSQPYSMSEALQLWMKITTASTTSTRLNNEYVSFFKVGVDDYSQLSIPSSIHSLSKLKFNRRLAF